MAIAFVGSANVFGFADGDTGHTCTHATGAPSVDDLDVLLINSNTILDSVTSSAGAAWTQRVDATSNQGAYLYSRKATGGEPADVVVNTSGNHNTDVIWLRFSGTDAYDPPGGSPVSVINNTNGTTLGALTTGTLPATGMLLVAAGFLHNFDGTLATSPVWINAFTAAGAVSSGTDGSSLATVAFGGYKLNVGTTSEDVGGSLSWTNNARNRYAVFAAFTAAGGAAVDVDASLSATGTITSTAAVDRAAAAAFTTTGTLVSTAAVDRAADGSLSGTATLASTAAVDRAATATLSATATLTATAAVDRAAMAAFTATATLTASAEQPDARATSTATAAAGRTSTPTVTARRTSTPTVTGG